MAQGDLPLRRDDGSNMGAYEVVRRIGGGSFGEVFLVSHGGEGRQYVMKEIGSFATMDTKQRESTELEVQLLSKARHPFIVAYRDSFVKQDGHLSIIMEYCEHGDVHSYMQDEKRAGRAAPSEPRVLEWFVQLALALHALHIKRVLHRDVKTQNVFLAGCGGEPQIFTVKLGDFGIAKVLNGTTDLAMTQIGTPFYMSPELFNNKPYGYKSDVWGLGCVLYEFINGQNAFEAQSINGLAIKILKGRYTPITSNCSDEIKCLIKSLLSHTPSQRPSLQEVFHMPFVRQYIPAALQGDSVASGTIEQRTEAQEQLAEQLALLGLGGLVGRPEADSAGPRRDRRQLQHRIDKAERRKKREEENLRRLQENAALLGVYLKEAYDTHQTVGSSTTGGVSPPVSGSGVAGPPSWIGQSQMVSGGYGGPALHLHGLPSQQPSATPFQEFGGYGGAHARHRDHQSKHMLPLAPLPLAPLATGGFPNTARSEQDEDSPALSHRDRVLLRKERRREEEQQRFEEEAKKIREQNLAYQRAWVQGSRDHHKAGGASSQQRHPTIKESAHHYAALPPLQDDHASNPFQSHQPNVVHSPSGSHLGRFNAHNQEPRPPAVQYGEPPAPHQRAGQHKHRWSRWSGAADHGSTTRSLQSIYLEALVDPPPEHSEESEFSPSISECSDDEGGRSSQVNSSDEQLIRQSKVVQRRIDQCRAAIYRHRTTIEMLQHTAGPGLQHTAGSGLDLDHDLVSVCDDTPLSQRAAPTSARRRGPAPAIVQDRVARLRRRCLEGLGAEKFQAARRHLEGILGAEEGTVRERMLEMLGLDKIGFYALIDQIVYMEQRWGSQELG